jgi:hypothetical protein
VHSITLPFAAQLGASTKQSVKDAGVYCVHLGMSPTTEPVLNYHLLFSVDAEETLG